MEQLYTTDRDLLWVRLAEFPPMMRKTGEWGDYAGVVVLCDHEDLTRAVAQWAKEVDSWWNVRTGECVLLMIIGNISGQSLLQYTDE